MSKRLKKEQRAKQAAERLAALDRRLLQITAAVIAASWLLLGALWYFGTLQQVGAFAIAAGAALLLLNVVRYTYGITPSHYTVVLGGWAVLLGYFGITGRHTITAVEVITVPVGVEILRRLFQSREARA